jgi:TPR repeat protein
MLSGVTQDYTEASRWYGLAAAQGDANAQHNLGRMYYSGLGVPQDYKDAVRWYRMAADQGRADAQDYLGDMYAKGQGVSKDYIQAHMWLSLAAANGNAEAVKHRDEIAKKMTLVRGSSAPRWGVETESTSLEIKTTLLLWSTS